jgi:hypothetical protein
MRKNLIFFTFLVISTFTARLLPAQDYVVTVTEDTIRGTLKPFNFGQDKKVQVIDGQKKKTQVSIFKTRSYFYKGDIYQPVKTETGYEYMKLLKSGYLSLYGFIPEKQSSYDGRYLLKRDGKGMEVPNLSFKRMMTQLLSDCPVVSDKIEKGDLGKKDLDKIIDTYNQCIDDKSRVRPAAVVNPTPPAVPVNDTGTWTSLEEKVKRHADFDGKENAVEMIADIKSKVSKGEKIPNFLSEGLKSVLSATDLKEDLDKALAESGGAAPK